MNKTGKPINLSKYPLIAKCYNLVRDIDSLPASPEATYLVVKAGKLMDDLWNYLEEHQPKERLSNVMQETLEARYKGKKIRNVYGGIDFTVDYVEVTPDGPDPQMTVLLGSNRYKEAAKVWREWQLQNNPLGKNPTPPEVEEPWRDAGRECFTMSQVDDALPEIIE